MRGEGEERKKVAQRQDEQEPKGKAARPGEDEQGIETKQATVASIAVLTDRDAALGSAFKSSTLCHLGSTTHTTSAILVRSAHNLFAATRFYGREFTRQKIDDRLRGNGERRGIRQSVPDDVGAISRRFAPIAKR